jgi:hypothetical protein
VSLKNAKGLVEGLAADLAPDLVAAPDPEAGPDPVAAPGPVAGPGLRTGPSPVLGPEVVPNQLTERTKKVEPTKGGPGLGPRTGPSLETVPNLGPDLRIGPNQGTDLNQNLDLVLNPGMIKQEKNPFGITNLRIFEKKIVTQHGKIKNNFSISFFCQNFFEEIKTFICASIALIKIPWEGPGSIPS